MKDQIDYKLLKKYVGGHYSLKDFKLISRWFEDPNSKSELKNALEQHWNDFSSEVPEAEKDLNSVLIQLKQKIAFEKPGVNLRIRLQRFYARAAAILLLPLLLYSMYSTFLAFSPSGNSSLVEIYSPQGARTHFQLPDGTQGWLNSGSFLKYATNFERNRKVQLSGEAWFEVTHNKHKPFVVNTPAADIRVLGTKFNVASFPGENVTEVVLQEGKVQVDGKADKFSSELKPNERFIYNNLLKTSSIQKVNAGQFSAWKDGLLVFRNEPLSEVLKRIGRWYNVDIVLNDPILQKFRYRATFQDEQIEEVIRLISLTAPIEYSFDNRKMNGDGTFKKRSIIIRRKGN